MAAAFASLPGVSSVGVDIVSVARVARVLARFRERFLARAFHPREAAAARSLPAPRAHEFLASRWAAKEALHKAARTQRLLFPDVEVVRAPSGAPSFALHGAAATWAHGAAVHLSLSHEAEFAVAFVVIAGPSGVAADSAR